MNNPLQRQRTIDSGNYLSPDYFHLEEHEVNSSHNYAETSFFCQPPKKQRYFLKTDFLSEENHSPITYLSPTRTSPFKEVETDSSDSSAHSEVSCFCRYEVNNKCSPWEKVNATSRCRKELEQIRRGRLTRSDALLSNYDINDIEQGLSSKWESAGVSRSKCDLQDSTLCYCCNSSTNSQRLIMFLLVL